MQETIAKASAIHVFDLLVPGFATQDGLQILCPQPEGHSYLAGRYPANQEERAAQRKRPALGCRHEMSGNLPSFWDLASLL